MVFAANVISIFIACPSDAESEKKEVIDAINYWNYSNAQLRNPRVIFITYSGKSACPLNSKGGGQARVSNTILKKSDLLLAVFKKKKGMPTKEYDSGTVEEITRHIKAKKPAAVYLCHVDDENERELSLRRYIKNTLEESHLFYQMQAKEDFQGVLQPHINTLLDEILNSKFTLQDENSIPVIHEGVEKIVSPCIVAKIDTRENYYKVLARVIANAGKGKKKASARINDTTWGTSPDDRDKCEQEAYELFLKMREKFVKRGRYREIYSEDKLTCPQILESLEQSKKFTENGVGTDLESNLPTRNKTYYEYRVINGSCIPMFVYISVDKKEVFLGMMQRRGHTPKFLHLVSEEVGDFFEDWFNDCWSQTGKEIHIT